VDLLRAFVSKVRRSPARYAGVDSDPEVVYERMPSVHFAIDGKPAFHPRGVMLLIVDLDAD
jgi:hypothetical protein